MRGNLDPKPTEDEAVSCADGVDLRMRLKALTDSVEGLLSEPLHPRSEYCCGYIESISVDPDGDVWVIGWLHGSLGHEFGVVIVDRSKYVGGISMVCYDRDDLPAGTNGIIGVIQTGWCPDNKVADVFFFCGPDGKLFLRSASPLEHLDDRGVALRFSQVQAGITRGHVVALQSLLLGINRWSPDTVSFAGFSVEAAIDELLVLPGFGCLARGWVISPTKPISELSLRLGQRILRPAVGSLSLLPRPDLIAVYPQAPRLLDRAGFIVALEGAVTSEDLTNPILKVHFADGNSVNVRVDPRAMRRLGHAVPISEALRLYPALVRETFFGRFASTMRTDIVSRLRQVTVITPCTPSPRWLVAALPGSYSDARLLVDEITVQLAAAERAPQVLLLADWSHDRTKLPLLAEVVTSRTGRQCGIYLIEQVDKPFWALPHILALLGCLRFFFLASNAFPNRTAWKGALAALNADDQGLKAMRMQDDDRLAGFVWLTRDFDIWSRTRLPIGARHAAGLTRKVNWLPGVALSTVGLGPADQLLEEADNRCLTKLQNTSGHHHA